MLASVTDLQDFTLRAMDGEIGKVNQFYFDDETWAIRYLVVNTGSWLAGRLVLISPIAVGQTDWESNQLEVVLTKKQVEGSPDIDTHKPVSRQHEAEYLGYYGYPFIGRDLILGVLYLTRQAYPSNGPRRRKRWPPGR